MKKRYLLITLGITATLLTGCGGSVITKKSHVSGEDTKESYFEYISDNSEVIDIYKHKYTGCYYLTNGASSSGITQMLKSEGTPYCD